jgi:hypothetical protein
MTAEQYLTGEGLARTSHGALVAARDVFDWAAGDYRLLAVVIDRIKGVTAYSDTRRLYSENQRLIRHAIDGGCTFPNCPMPALWCELDHTLDYANGGPTSVTNAALACDYDNRERKKQGWKPIHLNGRVAWTPPRWIDPHQRPRFNNLHRPDDPH